MTFTIEPMINLGTHRDVTWPDNWTSTTQDGKWSAQFGEFLCRRKSCFVHADFNAEHTLLVTETGVEILTARLPDSPGGPVPMPTPSAATNGTNGTNGAHSTNGTNGSS